MSQPESGLTPEEQQVMDALVEAWNRFKAIDEFISLDEQRDFNQAIHAAQQVLMGRIVRRLYPEYWR